MPTLELTDREYELLKFALEYLIGLKENYTQAELEADEKALGEDFKVAEGILARL